MKRIYSIDATRGMVMIIMALDHVRDLMHINAVTQSPTDLSTTTPLLFFTRWITYLCAPIFVFLAGTSAYMAVKNKIDVKQMKKHFFRRGCWLILVDLIVVNLGLFFDAGFHTVMFEVVATIGFGFIMMGLLLKLSSKAIGLTGLIIIFGHNLFDLVQQPTGSLLLKIVSPFLGMAVFPFLSNHVFVVAYPPIPWLGIMLTGFGAGKLFEASQPVRSGNFLRIGIVALVLFALIRFVNWYGDPAVWSVQQTGMLTFLSFMNITKYPPSLLFCLVTLGMMFLILGAVERGTNGFTGLAYRYGKVPLFYFIVHFYIIHILLILLLFAQGFHWQQFDFASGTFGRPKGITSGLPLWAVYLVWLGVVALLYKPCVWYGNYKSTHKNWWLAYL